MALVATVLTANAAEYPLSLDNLGSGWGSEYDAATKTITYTGEWSGRGWWFGTDTPLDATGYDEVVVEYEPSEFTVQLVIEYNGAESTTSSSPAGESMVVGKIADSNIKQIYLQNSQLGSLTLTNAYLRNSITYEEIPLTIYEKQSLLKSEWSSLPEEALVRFTVENTSGESRQGWGIGGIFAYNNWEGEENTNKGGAFGYKVSGAAETIFTFDLTIPKLNELCIAGGQDLGGITWNIYNGYAIIGVTALVPEGSVEPQDPNLIFEGNMNLSWGGIARVDVAKYELALGDVIVYEFSEVSDDKADWGYTAQANINIGENKPLMGAAKMGYYTLKAGTVKVGVTQELLDAATEAGSFSLMGSGATLAKAYIVRGAADFDESILVWGSRTGAVEVFTTIPETAKYLNITMDKVPNYMAVCNGSWAEIAQPVNRIYTADDAPVTYQVEVTPELLAAINGASTLIINGNEDSEFVSLSVGDELIVDYDLTTLKRVESVEDVPASYSTPLEITPEELPGLGKGSQLVITYTRGTDEVELSVYAIVEGSEPMQLPGTYPAYGTGYVIIPLTEEQVVAISKGTLRIEGHDMIINKIYYSEGEEITGIADINVDANAPVEYFNLQGIKISADDATNGIFIRRQGGKSVKVAR